VKHRQFYHPPVKRATGTFDGKIAIKNLAILQTCVRLRWMPDPSFAWVPWLRYRRIFKLDTRQQAGCPTIIQLSYAMFCDKKDNLSGNSVFISLW